MPPALAQDLAGPASARTTNIGSVRLATWNVNSARQRLPRLLPWLDQRQPDIACLQETKLADDAFEDLLGGHLHNRGYEFAAHGEAQWNGVAILSRVGLDDVVAGVERGPRLPEPGARPGVAARRRSRRASVGVP